MSDETIITKLDTLLDDEQEGKPHLTFIWGQRMGELYPLDLVDTIVGRANECNLWIEDGAISRKHFSIHVVKGKAVLKDLGSTNGTLLNGEKVTEHPLEDGDKIQISRDTILEFNYLDETRQLSEKKRYEMGVIDPVTGSYNKRYFIGRMKEEFSFAQRTKRELTIILFDIDHFKNLNDNYGHLAGDFVLQKLGALVARTIRTHDIFSRYGGEEFIILMRDTDIQNAVNLAERIRRAVEKNEFIYENKRLPVTISSGVAALSADMKKDGELIASADRFLYEAKGGGRNNVKGPLSPNPIL